MSFVDRGDDPSDQKLRTFMCLLFTESSFAFRFLLVLNDRIKSHLTVLESAQYRDKRFATKFRFALDTRYFRWMEQCKGSKDRESVNNQLLKFDTLLDSVLTEQFHQTIPSTMRLVDDVKIPSSTGSGSLKDPDTKIVCPRSIVLYCLRHSTIARSS